MAEKHYNKGEKGDLLPARLDKLAALYYTAGRYEKAEPLCKRALEIRKDVFGRDDPRVASRETLIKQLLLRQQDVGGEL